MSFLPSGVPSHAWANPIQHVPSRAARAASIRFSGASEQSSTAHRSVRHCRDHDEHGRVVEDIEIRVGQYVLEMV